MSIAHVSASSDRKIGRARYATYCVAESSEWLVKTGVLPLPASAAPSRAAVSPVSQAQPLPSFRSSLALTPWHDLPLQAWASRTCSGEGRRIQLPTCHIRARLAGPAGHARPGHAFQVITLA